ncbi:MAG: Gmad2 immunoglobulin-like domain-containing protein, partial [Litorilinea sp.]
EDADAQGHIHNETHVALHTEMYGEPSAALALWQAVAEEQEADAGRIHVFSPAAGGAHHSQIEVIGLSQTFEGNVEMQLRAEDGEVLAERYTTGGSVDGYDFFRTGLRFTVQEPVSATLVVFEQSMQDGGMMQEVEIPLTLLPGQRFIDIHQPKEGARLCETVLLAGYSNTFEGNVSLEITDPAGEILALGYATGGTFGIYREFFHSFDFQSDSPTPILITAYELDAAGFYDRVDPITVPASYFPGDASECQ